MGSCRRRRSGWHQQRQGESLMLHMVENGADYSANLGYESRLRQMAVVL
jgi:hypothetical protein